MATTLRDILDKLLGRQPASAKTARERLQLVLNKGTRDGVFVGQPLIDADGLMGQVVEVSDGSSRALLITDVTHSVPVQVNRNGVRAIVEGTGRLSSLEVRHVSATTDIETGDLLVTSGLGGRFPEGYPVAVVTEVQRDAGELFARVLASPIRRPASGCRLRGRRSGRRGDLRAARRVPSVRAGGARADPVGRVTLRSGR